MDAPTPSPPNEIEIESKSINFSHENKNYILKYILYSSYITFNVNSVENNETYESQYSFDEINKMNRYFLICETLKDIYDEISSIINKKKFDITILNNEINLKIFLPSQKLKEIVFILQMKYNLVDCDIKNLNKRIDNQDRVIREQNSRISNLEFDFLTSNDMVKKLEKKIDKLLLSIDNNNLNDNKNVENKDNKTNIIKINNIINKDNVIKINNQKYEIKINNKKNNNNEEEESNNAENNDEEEEEEESNIEEESNVSEYNKFKKINNK